MNDHTLYHVIRWSVRFPVATQPFDDVFSPDRLLNKCNNINSLRICH